MKTAVKQLKSMYVYEILLESNKPLSRKEIAHKLKVVYGITESDKTLTEFLKNLMDADLITAEEKKRESNLKNKNGHKISDTTIHTDYKLKERPFNDKELLWLIDNAIFSKQLSESASKSIVSKLIKFGSKALKDKVMAFGNNKHYFHSSNNEVSDNIDTLSSAIKEAKSITFTLMEYATDLKLHPSPEGDILIKPLRLIPINDFYYVIAFEPESNSIQHYRIDLMRNINITDTYIEFDRTKNTINVDEYLSTHSLMKNGKAELIKLKLPEEKIGLVIDRFGTNLSITYDGDYDIIVTLKSNPTDLYIWSLENGEYVEVIEPQHIRNKIRETAKTMHLTYSKEALDKYYLALERAKKPIMHIYRFGCPDFDLSTRNEWKGLTNLNELYIENNNISDLSVICELTNLRKVQIVNEKISDISSLLKFERLRSLCLSDTLVEDISILEQINPRWLKLTGNYNITDYSVLSRLSSLKVLWLDEETFEKIDIKAIKDNNPQIQITYEHETDGMIKV